MTSLVTVRAVLGALIVKQMLRREFHQKRDWISQIEISSMIQSAIDRAAKPGGNTK